MREIEKKIGKKERESKKIRYHNRKTGTFNITSKYDRISYADVKRMLNFLSCYMYQNKPGAD